MSYRDKLLKTGPRKLLASDGGGIRGIIISEVLARIEAELRKTSGNPKLVLADYFDYVAGTSTGAIIATLIALGHSTDEIRDFYLRSGAEMFHKARLWERFRTKFESDKLTEMLRDVIGEDTTLGSDKLHTLLMMVLRNATTDSPWPLTNNPAAKYNDLTRPGCNLKLPVWQLVRASTAAPTYFPPEVIHIDHDFIFVDGGVTMYNNPAFQLFLMATSEPYRLLWSAGQDKMLLISGHDSFCAHGRSAARAGLSLSHFREVLGWRFVGSRDRHRDWARHSECAEAIHLCALQRRAFA